MVRFLVLYGKPADTDAFDEHYRDVHMPLARKLPGLLRYTVSRGLTVAQGDDPCYLAAELDWDDMAAFQAALGSPEGKAAAADLANLAEGGIRTMVYELEDV